MLFGIKFKPGGHFPIVRRKHFTITEIFAFIGGLLGLFLGISVASFAEAFIPLLRPLSKISSTMVFFQKIPSQINRKRNRFSESIGKVKSYVGFFLKESSIHSFHFLGYAEECLERMFWILIVGISMTGCFLMILQLNRTMDFKAVTVVIDDQLMDVSEIPFPAVTMYNAFPKVRQHWQSKLFIRCLFFNHHFHFKFIIMARFLKRRVKLRDATVSNFFHDICSLRNMGMQTDENGTQSFPNTTRYKNGEDILSR